MQTITTIGLDIAKSIFRVHLEVTGLALLYPALERNVSVPGHHGYPRALDLIRDSAPKARRAT